MPTETKEMTLEDATEAAGGSPDADASPDAVTECADDADEATDASTDEPGGGNVGRRRVSWSRVLVFGLLPALALVLAGAAGFLKWQDASMRAADSGRLESMQAAKDSAVALLSYQPDTVEKDLNAARDRLTGKFRESYTSLINDVVIPGAKQKKISAVASVPAAASVSAGPDHAVVLLFVNQTIFVGTDPPSATASSVRVTMDRVGGRWLISDFTPV